MTNRLTRRRPGRSVLALLVADLRPRGLRRRAAEPGAGRARARWPSRCIDVWGEAALKLPGGPSYEAFRDLLPPLRYTNTRFRDYPVVLSAPAAPAKARWVSNGSAVNARADKPPMWKEAGLARELPRRQAPAPVRRRPVAPRRPPLSRRSPAGRPGRRTPRGRRSTSKRPSPRSAARWPTPARSSSGSRPRARPARWRPGSTRRPPVSAGGGSVRDAEGRALVLYGPGWTWDAAARTLRRAGAGTPGRAGGPHQAARAAAAGADRGRLRRGAAGLPRTLGRPAGERDPAVDPRAGRSGRLAVAHRRQLPDRRRRPDALQRRQRLRPPVRGRVRRRHAGDDALRLRRRVPPDGHADARVQPAGDTLPRRRAQAPAPGPLLLGLPRRRVAPGLGADLGAGHRVRDLQPPQGQRPAPPRPVRGGYRPERLSR